MELLSDSTIFSAFRFDPHTERGIWISKTEDAILATVSSDSDRRSFEGTSFQFDPPYLIPSQRSLRKLDPIGDIVLCALLRLRPRDTALTEKRHLRYVTDSPDPPF